MIELANHGFLSILLNLLDTYINDNSLVVINKNINIILFSTKLYGVSLISQQDCLDQKFQIFS
jgi:hypothetical protein